MSILLKVKKALYPSYLAVHYFLVRKRQRCRRRLRPPQTPQFLFVLCAPFSGSTLLHELLCTSRNVSPNNTIGTREGQQLPGVKPAMWDHGDAWNPNREYDWRLIRKEWFKYWDTTQPILLEKSPSNLVRIKAIEQHFRPVRFVCLVRNPYANAEGFIRRGIYPAARAAEFVIRCLSLQKDYLETSDSGLLLSYETLVDQPEATIKKLVDFVPKLADIHYPARFGAHNALGKKLPLTNLNKSKVARLTREQVDEINTVFTPHASLLNYFGYAVCQDREGLLWSVRKVI